MTGTWIGMDAGASGTKVVALRPGGRERRRFATRDPGALEEFVRAHQPTRVAATGAGGVALVERFADLGSHGIEEFQAWADGAARLARAHGLSLDETYLVASVGTGTSVILAGDRPAERAGGCALGGGTLVGLGRLLLGTDDHEVIAGLAARGDRMRMDLQIHDLYPEFPPGFTASNFGARPHAGSEAPRREDIAHALAVMVGENISILCCAIAAAQGVRQIVYGGGTLRDNPACWEIIERMAQVRGFQALALPEGEYAGAEGALAAARGA